jgi:hypothetical protein
MKNKQNKLKIMGFGFVLALLFGIVSQATAANFSVSDSYISVEKGDIIEIVVYASSLSENSYTFKSSINFSSDLLSVSDWQWADNWMPLVVEEYDLIDNDSGKIIKTAGYPTGLSDKVEFGVVTFVAKESGQAVVSFGYDSFILNADGNDTY